MSCHPEEVTAFVDGELSGTAGARMRAHLASPCPRCLAQCEEECAVRRHLRGTVPSDSASAGFEARIQGALDREDAA